MSMEFQTHVGLNTVTQYVDLNLKVDVKKEQERTNTTK